jgi:hypothetical protein
MKRILKRILSILVGFQGLSGLAGGFGLILDPTGELLGLTQDWLVNTIFDTYLIPGVILFFVLGIFPTLCYIGMWKQRAWAVTGSFLTGIALIIWIAVEIFMIGYHISPPLQLIYGIVGILIAFISSILIIKETKKGTTR